MNKKRFTARGILVRGDELLLMERWRDNKHYFSIPGGLVEPRETPEQTVPREVLEETTIHCRVKRSVLELRHGEDRHIIYECLYLSGEPSLPESAEEAKRSKQQNFYEPKWIPISTLNDIPFGYWEPLKRLLIDGLHSGFSNDVQVVTL